MNKRFLTRCSIALLSGAAALFAGPMTAQAGMPIPAPLAGLAGPYGLLAAGAVYGGYRLVRYFRQRP